MTAMIMIAASPVKPRTAYVVLSVVLGVVMGLVLWVF